MTWLDLIAVPLLAKICLVSMFPLSAYDKIVHWGEAMDQAKSGPLPFPALLLILGIAVEAITPALIVIGLWDRAAAFVLAGFLRDHSIVVPPVLEVPTFLVEERRWSGASLGLLQKFRSGRRPLARADRRELRACLASGGASSLERTE